MPRSWETFASTVGLASVEPEASAEVPALSRLKKLALGAAVALGLLWWLQAWALRSVQHRCGAWQL